MTPEDRITLTRIDLPQYHLPDYYFYNNSDILEYFATHAEYRKAKDIYWYYQNIHSTSPYTNVIPPLKTEEEYVLRYKFHTLMNRKFYINK